MALFFLWDERGILHGIVGLHADDILAAEDEFFEAKLEEVNKAVGFWFRQEEQICSLWQGVRESHDGSRQRANSR